MSDLNHTLAQWSALISAKKISAVELTQLYLQQITQWNAHINAFITVDAERSLAQAKQADQKIAQGQGGALVGIPIAQKDIFCIQDWRTTCGSKMLANFIAPYDAHIISLCNQAGLVTIGKTNMDEFAMGSSNETSYFGAVKNPWDVTAVPGGSSGGAAAALAARMAPAATGTDTGGSIRQPAALCGVSGIKPTYGLASRYGMIAFASSLDQAGPMAKSAEDLAHLLNVMVGFDERDSTSLNRPKEDYTQQLTQPLQGLRIGLPQEFFAEGLDSEVAKAIDTAISELKKLGCAVVEIQLPKTELSIPVYYVLAPAEASSNLSRYDGVRYGYRTKEYQDLLEMYEKTRAEGFGEEVKRRILMGTYVLSAGYYDAYYHQAQKIRRLIAEDFQQAFSQCDLILGPTSPTAAFDLNAKNDDPVQMYLSDIYTIAVNLAGLPGMSIPVGFNTQDRPIGMQIIGNYFQEARMLQCAHAYQNQTDWHLREPQLMTQSQEVVA